MHKPFSPILPSFLKKSCTFLFIFLFPYVFVDNRLIAMLGQAPSM